MSFVIQGGKCRYCRESISWQYPLVEFATGILFAVAYFISGFDFLALNLSFFNLFWMWFVIAVMIVIFVYDLKYYLILDKVVYPAIILAIFAVPLLHSGGVLWWQATLNSLLAASIGGGFFLLQYLVSRGKWIGGGDVKMGFLMGLILGIKGLLTALFFSYTIGALFGLALIVFRRKTMKSQLPFGTFLAVGTLIALFWGEKILQWYLG
jgi:prepilin signal peptidase PulO-like enzyme (type II secretory pathway)